MFGELGDLCTFLDQENLRPAEIGFEVQRFWSNKASVAGGYPCTPVTTTPYYQAITTATDSVQVPDYGDPSQMAMVTTKAISIEPGGSRTVDVYVYSDQGDSTVVPIRALSHADVSMTGMPSGFTFQLKNQPNAAIRCRSPATRRPHRATTSS